VTKTAIFENSRWRTAAILKIALSPYLSRELSDFDQILYTDTHFHSEHAHFRKNRKFSKSRWRTDAILKTIFVYISAPYWPINVKFGMEMTNHYADRGHVTKNGNFPKFKMADGRHFENSFRCIRHSCDELILSSVFQ